MTIASPQETATHGPVHLNVTDAERSLRFWRDSFGLELLDREQDRVVIGASGRPLLVLHPGAGQPWRQGHTGLYHLAIHVPDAAEFAYVLARLYSARIPHRPTEHYFSKATYFDDPDGIGIEVTLETPERVAGVTTRGGRPLLIDQEGNGRPPVDHLDLEEAMGHLEEENTGRPLAGGTRIGHVHLHVNDMDATEGFYRDLLGFPNGYPMPGSGMSDVHFEGAFRHRIAFNVWQGPNAAQAPDGVSGLRHFTLMLDEDDLRGRLDALDAAGHPVEQRGDGHLVRDPAGNALLLAPRPAPAS
jgi:catechol 2,3-dioxygenase